MTDFNDLNYQSVDLAKAEYMKAEAEKKLLATIEAVDAIEQKALKLLGFSLAAVGILSASLVGAVKSFPIIVLITALCSAPFFLIGFYKLLSVILPKDVHTQGTDPAVLLREEYFSCTIEMMMISEAINYQERITQNAFAGERAAKALKIGALGIIGGLTVTPILFWRTLSAPPLF